MKFFFQIQDQEKVKMKLDFPSVAQAKSEAFQFFGQAIRDAHNVLPLDYRLVLTHADGRPVMTLSLNADIEPIPA